MATKIDTVTARARLAPRREPYWHRLAKGSFLGFRLMSKASGGNWLARTWDEAHGRDVFNPLGDFGNIADHKRFDAARKAAEDWFGHLGKGGSATSATVREACSRYVKHVRATKGTRAAQDAEARFDAYVLNDARLAEADVAKLTPLLIDGWRESLRTRPTASGGNRGDLRTAATLNRDMTPFRAALNLALSDGLVTSDFAWRVKLRPLKDADRRRELYLDKDQRRKFIEKAQPDIGLFLHALSLLPLRPGALAALTVADFDKRLGTLKIGQDKAGHVRMLKLPEATAEFFGTAAKDKLPGAPLLARADGKAWTKDAWKWPVKAAATAAKLPAGATAYTLRHSTISDLVHGGLDLLTVAQVSGTSVRMIEQHYGHLRGNVAAAALAKLAL